MLFRDTLVAAPLKLARGRGRVQGLHRHLFRDTLVAAPLKPQGIAGKMSRVIATALPRHPRRGPIEASRSDRRRLELWRTLPRHPRRGPIEAAMAYMLPPGFAGLFRDTLVAAPLKHDAGIWERWSTCRSPLPRHPRRGPIEAFTAADTLGPVVADSSATPSSRAPLKHVVSASSRRATGLDLFRDTLVAAPLKLLPRMLGLDLVELFRDTLVAAPLKPVRRQCGQHAQGSASFSATPSSRPH